MREHARNDLAAPDLIELLSLMTLPSGVDSLALQCFGQNAVVCCATFVSPWATSGIGQPCPPCSALRRRRTAHR